MIDGIRVISFHVIAEVLRSEMKNAKEAPEKLENRMTLGLHVDTNNGRALVIDLDDRVECLIVATVLIFLDPYYIY